MLVDLVQYYHCLSKRENSPILPKGYSKVGIPYHLILTKEGTIQEILPYTRTVMRGTKGVEAPKEEVFPWRYSVSATSAETIEHREKYTFGLLWDKESSSFVESLDAFQKNKEKNLFFLEDLTSPVVDAYKLFLSQWTPCEEVENPHLRKLGKDFSASKYVISLEDTSGFLHKDPQVLEKWDKFWLESSKEEGAVMGQCGISGKTAPLARTHTKLKGVGGQASGVGLVSFNEEAYESYGKKQAYNSSTSQEVMEQYTETFNFLANDLQHRQSLDDMTLLFWAMTSEDEGPVLEEAQGWLGFSSVYIKEEDSEVVEESLQSAITSTVQGKGARLEALEQYQSVDFYILGVKPNTSRLSVKFFQKNKFGTFQKNIALHQKHCSFTDEDKPLSLRGILAMIKSPVAPEDAPPDLQTKLLHSILTGDKYPDYLLHHTIYRVKIDKDKEDKGKKFIAISRGRVRLIRACLIRKNMIKWEDTTMLQKETTETAYLCGRLFALLEEIQRKAQGKEVNATIKDKFFASACTTPSLVFPRLLKLSQNHVHKLEEKTAYFAEKELAEVMGAMCETFPKNLNMDKQGLFILGYYQQKDSNFQAAFKRKQEKEENDQESEEH